MCSIKPLASSERSCADMQIVAPSGSFSALRAAVNAGADAVYLGMPQFGARAKAENFGRETLKLAIDYAHLFGVKVFITLNTLIKDGEMTKALDTARFAYDCGADAAIVQDLRFVKELKRTLADFPLHASTQMGIHNADGAKMLADLGIRRAVLSRETLPSDIVEIKKTGIEIEYFVQGALCVSFSGNCYFSSLASSYSGNRGKCMQLCRKKYMFNGNRGYFLSAKDLCLYDRLSELEAIGVDAIKIEGRMRSDEYVSQAVRVYKSAMPTNEAVGALKAVFNRGDYCTAYMDADAPYNIIYEKVQANIGSSVGKIDCVRGKKITVTGVISHSADGYKVLRNGIEVGGAKVAGGEIISDADCVCKTGDELRRTFDGALSERLKAIERKIDVGVSVRLSKGDYPTVTLVVGNTRIEERGDSIVQPAITRGITESDIVRAFNKVSGYPFLPKISVDMDNDVFMPVSEINKLRRSAYESMRVKLIGSHSAKRETLAANGLHYNKFDGCGTIVTVENERQLSDKILSMADYIAFNPLDYSRVSIPSINKPILLNLPIVMRGADKDIIMRAIGSDRVYGVISNNLYTLGITDKPILLGVGHNIIGELDLPHIRSFEADSINNNAWVYVYGYAPVMTLCHCPYGKCVGCTGDDVLIDEQNRKFKLRRYKLAHCYWQLLNCVPHNLVFNSSVEYKNKFYDCTELAKSDIEKLLCGEHIDAEYTRGNINKGLK